MVLAPCRFVLITVLDRFKKFSTVILLMGTHSGTHTKENSTSNSHSYKGEIYLYKLNKNKNKYKTNKLN